MINRSIKRWQQQWLPVAGCDEDGEPAERVLSSQPCDAARSPEEFWEDSVCLSGSQGNRESPVGDITRSLSHLKPLIGSHSPQESASFSASDWAVAVCRHLGGSAGGSAVVAKGTGSSSDITKALRFAEEFARQKKKR